MLKILWLCFLWKKYHFLVRHRLKIAIFHTLVTPLSFNAPIKGILSQFRHISYRKTRMVGLSYGEKSPEDSFTCFDRIMDRHHTMAQPHCAQSHTAEMQNTRQNLT